MIKENTFNLEKWIIINSNITITLEEEREIMDLIKQVLRREHKNENRKIFIVEDIDFIAKEYC